MDHASSCRSREARSRLARRRPGAVRLSARVASGYHHRMRLLRGSRWHGREDAKHKLLALGLVVTLTPVFAFALDWRLGLAIVAAYGALAFGVWRVSRQR